MDEIRVYPPGARVTDTAVAEYLARETPKSFSAAQNLLVAAEKYRLRKGGIFSSQKARIQKLQDSVYALQKALKDDRYAEGVSFEREEKMVFEYLSRFSAAFPNWQPEYEALNKFIPQCL